ncbi:glycosyltransferase [Paenibacillus sp. PL2-23]|uniref:glycosyltransferase family 2 protein n=1 Tax=Paenibacillus sp. PL2-23 TaxID=2100729 RepID=UPI0030F7823E
MPTYNKANYLDLTLASFVNQDDQDFEIIVVDDGSTDNTKDVVRKYERTINLKYLTHTNRGRAYARNTALQHAAGRYILFNDDDRIASPCFVSMHKNELEKGGEKRVVIGWKHNILTVYHPSIKLRQRELVCLFRKSPHLGEIFEQPEERRLIQRDCILGHHWDVMEPYIVTDGYDNFPRVVDTYGEQLSGFHFKWILGTTANLSLHQSLLSEVGMFDTRFKGWGMEDTDLSYRFWGSGADLQISKECVNYHQYHPREQSKVSSIRNAVEFCKKYQNLECYLFLRCWNLSKIHFEEANRLYEFAMDNATVKDELCELYRSILEDL